MVRISNLPKVTLVGPLPPEPVRKGDVQEPMGERRGAVGFAGGLVSHGEGLRRPSSPG